jgi:hypothetical protein
MAAVPYTVSVENPNAELLSDSCLYQAEKVIWMSEANGFLP